MKTYLIIVLLLMNPNLYAQVSDSTLHHVFGAYVPKELLKLYFEEDHKTELTNDYLQALSFKIPLLNPIANQRINSSFGYRFHPLTGEMKKHQGIDLAGIKNQPIHAAADGRIIETGFHVFLGNYIKIQHLLGYESLYGHLSRIQVNLDDFVYQGQVIGQCGNTGRTTGVHLHFAILWEKQYLNPYSFIF
ncbi:M23 family metallopeptidase [Arcicella sp. LKC2W]|uniref:M23 family metallopeptidase n=1 Tax=Arcicella sp. LKC2W TaxID=2984198 RepID=UPI002B219EA6|nr:M23 family metallopeptidase [Arcicella sp. LKC2W]MEA5461639.1 M23 family metallopeptidase [Arcicella sp. LKC2W]